MKEIASLYTITYVEVTYLANPFRKGKWEEAKKALEQNRLSKMVIELKFLPPRRKKSSCSQA